jgi:hypothetical protein
LNHITYFQHNGAQAELIDAKKQMENIKEKITSKDLYIMELQEKIEKHRTEASEARKVEQVNHFQMICFPFHIPIIIKFGQNFLFMWTIQLSCISCLDFFSAGMPETGGVTDSFGASS